MTTLNDEQLQTKAIVLNALSNAYTNISATHAEEVQVAMNKLAVELSKEVKGLTL